MRRHAPSLALAAGLAMAAAVAGAPRGPVGATPLRQAPGVTCTWERLGRGEDRSQHALVTLPGVGVAEYGGAVRSSRETQLKDDVYVLDQRTDPSGTWSELPTTGAGPGNRIEHVSVMRTQGAAELISYGGLDEVDSGGRGTFTWRAPLLAGGLAEPGLSHAFSPSKVQRGGHALSIATGSGVWTALPGGADPLAESAGVYWPEGDSMVLFGGYTDDGVANSAVNKVYRANFGASPVDWTSATLPGGPTARFAHTAIYDSARQRMVVFGGTRNWTSGLNDVWALDLSGGWDAARWSELSPTGGAPGRRFDHAAAYMPNLGWMVVIGGTRNGTAVQSDVYALNLSSEPPAWIELAPGGAAPPGLQDYPAAWSDVEAMVVLHGGEVNSGSKRDAWGLRCAADTPPTPTDEPTATATDLPPTATDAPPTATRNLPADTPTPTEAPPEDTPTPPPPTPTPGPGDEGGTIWLPVTMNAHM